MGTRKRKSNCYRPKDVAQSEGISDRVMLQALAQGEEDAERLAALADPPRVSPRRASLNAKISNGPIATTLRDLKPIEICRSELREVIRISCELWTFCPILSV